MKTQTLPVRTRIVLGCGLAMLLLAGPAGAQLATNNYIYNGNQTGSPGTNWYGPGVTAYWKLNGTSTTTVQPFAGTATATSTNYNFFLLNSNGLQLGNGNLPGTIRDPYTSPYPNIATFPGDTLILATNTQIRFKHGGNSGTLVANVPFNIPTNNFPGNFGMPGLILNGGCLNAGDSGYAYVIMGTMYATPGTLSYLNPADSFAGDWVQRGLVINSQLSGSGALALLNATNNVPQSIQGVSNTFTGTWIVRAGWLRGQGDGTGDGYNSLGTNATCQYIINPLWTVPNTFASGSLFFNGPAVLDLGAALANCAGSLVLTNGGALYLHGNVIFSKVNVENYSLPNGTYAYATLAAMFSAANGYSNNFAPTGFPTGSGTLTVQPPGAPVIPPLVTMQPLPEILYAGRTASFTGAGNGTPPLYYQWLKNGSPINNGPTGTGSVVSGATSTNLVLSQVTSADTAGYSLVISNAFNIATSQSAALSVVKAVEPYETAVSNLNPVAFYQFNETANPLPGPAAALDYAGGFNGVYGTNVLNGSTGVTGPSATAGFPGFNSGNLAAQFTASVAGSQVAVPSWNLNTNTVTLSCWLYPSGPQLNSAGVIYCRGGDTVAGLCYVNVANPTLGGYDLGYNWNNDPNVYNWDSGLQPPAGQWSLVTLVVTPASATIYLMNASGLTSSTHIYPHAIQAFSAADTTLIGDDSLDGGNGSRSYSGMMDDVAVFNSALTGTQVANLFYAATGISSYAPIISVQPVTTTNAYTGQTIALTVGAGGSQPLGYQWGAAPIGSGGPYIPLVNGPGANGETISGAQSATLTIQNVALADALDYVVVVTNLVSDVTSTVATVTVTASGAPKDITLGVQQAAGSDWNTADQWSDNNPASVSAVEFPGSTYEVSQGARLRTPVNALTAVFPGNQLSIDGTGVFINNPAAGTLQGEMRAKQGVSPNGISTLTFPLLIMNGGQFDNGNAGVIDILGQVDIVSNAIFYVDNGGGSGRPIEIDAYLFGTNSIEYQDFDTTMTGGLVVTGATNTFSGTWNVLQGPLIGTSPGSLGTNSITVGAGAALETSYNLNDPDAYLYLNGVIYLHQNDTFHSVIIGSTALSAGTYTAAQLAAAYPATFPTNWTGHYGVQGYTNSSGSITVLASLGATVLANPTPAAVSLYPTQTAQFAAQGGGNAPLYYQWQLNGVNLVDGPNFIGSLSNVLTVANITAADAGNYTVVVSNSLGHATSAAAVLTVLPTSPAIQPITTSVFEASGSDWNTPGIWSDPNSLPASISALEYPGSTYEVQAGALLRTPAAVVPYTNFPGVSLQVDGSGVWINSPAAGSAQGEIRFKEGQNQEIVDFPLLIMNGGQLDNGSAFTLIIQGTIDIVSNTPIYVDSVGGEDRPYVIAAALTGNASIEYHDYDASLSGGLDITSATNTYTGTWNIVQGPLLGSGTNSLGTNSITLGTNGVLETLYNLNNPNATLTVNGAVYLHENDTFNQVAVNGVGLSAGVYSAAQLSAAFPTKFPANWNNIYGSTNTAAAGSLTVLSSLVLPPVIQSQPAVNGEEFVGAEITYSVTTGGNPGSYQWFLNGTAIAGATNVSYTFASLAGANVYGVQVSNYGGTAESLLITNLAVSPPTVVTLNDDTNWTVQGTGTTPSISSGVLYLTDNNGSEAASAFYNVAQYIEGFNAAFTYTPGGNLAADGVTFCVQNSAAGPAALGGNGGNLGYNGINQSAAFELNIYALATGGVGFGIGTNGTIANPYRSVAPVNLASGDPINVNLYYQHGSLQITLVDANTSETFVTNLNVADFGSVLGQSVGYIGFTAATGGSISSQQVSNFAFVPAALPVLSIANTSPTTSTLSWSGGVLTNAVLQGSSSLSGPWTDVATLPTLVGSQYQVVVPSAEGDQFFQLVIP